MRKHGVLSTLVALQIFLCNIYNADSIDPARNERCRRRANLVRWHVVKSGIKYLQARHIDAAAAAISFRGYIARHGLYVCRAFSLLS